MSIAGFVGFVVLGVVVIAACTALFFLGKEFLETQRKDKAANAEQIRIYHLPTNVRRRLEMEAAVKQKELSHLQERIEECMSLENKGGLE